MYLYTLHIGKVQNKIMLKIDFMYPSLKIVMRSISYGRFDLPNTNGITRCKRNEDKKHLISNRPRFGYFGIAFKTFIFCKDIGI